MSAPQDAPLPPDLNLYAGCIVRFAALDAATGNDVAGVTVTNASIWVTNIGGGSASELESGPFMLVPGPET